MTTLTTRSEILRSKRIISSELSKIQKGIYEYFEGDLNLEEYDCLKNEIAHYSTYNKIIGLDYFDIDTFTIKLTEKLYELFQVINATDFIIISHIKLDFFGNRENKFKPLTRAYQKLEKIVGDNTFKEAFTFDFSNLSEFLEIIFWITRCDPCVPEFIFIFDKNEQIQFQLSKYGNLYLTEYNREQLTDKKLKELGWTIIIEGQEFDNFTKDGKIKGRQFKI